MIGRTVSHYRIIEKLGEGGMGVVYRAEDTKLGRTVALKFLNQTALGSEEERRRFIHEAKAAAALNHPNISTIYEIEEIEGRSFIAMEHVEGESLADIIREKPLPVEKAIDIAIQASAGIQDAHEKGIIHRDIKSANIMITPKGRVKVMDFGLAKVPDLTQLTGEGTTLGTVAYMSPEQSRGDTVDNRSDIWSLGVVLYEMVTGQQPFKGEYDQAKIYSVLNKDPEPPTALRTGIPMEVERIILKALSKDPGERYQHADEMLADLKKLAGGLSLKRSSAGRQKPAEKQKKKIPTWLVIPVVLIAAIILWNEMLGPRYFGEEVIAAQKPVAVISFENMTGDPQYDYLSKAIPNLLITNLEQSKYISVITWERMRDLLRQLGKEDVETIDTELGFELCRLDGIEAVVVGSFVKAGNTFATELKVIDVESKELLETAGARGEGVASILESQIDELTKRISRGVGMSARKTEEITRPVIEMTTSSVEAYRFFLRGRDEYSRFYFADARRSLERAIEIDSTFAIAYLYLARVYGRIREIRLRDEAYENAMRYSSRVTERERLYISSAYAGMAENDPEKTITLLEELVSKYPKEKTAYYRLAMTYKNDKDNEDRAIDAFQGALRLDPYYAEAANSLAYVYLALEQYDKAIEYFGKYMELAPGDANPYDSMAETYYELGRIDEAIAYYKKALAIKPDFFGSMRNLVTMYFIKGDYDSTDAWFVRFIQASPSPGILASAYVHMSYKEKLTGDYETAIRHLDEAWRLFEEIGWEFGVTSGAMFTAEYYYEIGDYEKSTEMFERWIERARITEPEIIDQALYLQCYYRGLISLRSGDIEAAREKKRKLDEMWSGFSDDYIGEQKAAANWRYLLEAEILLAEKRHDDAIDLMKRGFRLTVPSILSKDFWAHNMPDDQDVVPRAYIAKGELDRAIEEYEDLLNPGPGSRDRRFKNPKYLYRLAKIYEQTGQIDKAIEKYRRFLYIWKEADEGLPELVDARMRLENLTGN